MMNVFNYENVKYVFVDELVDEYNKNFDALNHRPKQLRKTNVGKLAHCLGANVEKINLGKDLRLVVSEDAVTVYMNDLNKHHGKTHNNVYYETRSALLARALCSLDPFAVTPFLNASSASSARFSDTFAFAKPVILELKEKKKKHSKKATAPVMEKSPEEMVDYFKNRIQRRTELNQKDMKKLLEYKALADAKISNLGIAVQRMNEAIAA